MTGRVGYRDIDALAQIKGIVCFPIDLGFIASSFASLPLKPVFAISSIADAVLHFFSKSEMKIFQAAQKIEAYTTGIRCLGLAWCSGYLLQTLKGRTTVLFFLSDPTSASWMHGIYSWAA